jgi:hypothetical protein
MSVHEDSQGHFPRPSSPTLNEDDRELEALGYVPSFKREFSNLATVSCVSSWGCKNTR